VVLEKGWKFFLGYGSYTIAQRAGTLEAEIGFRPLEGFELRDDLFFPDPEGPDLIEIFP
jgi:hypothetical protein